MITHRRPRGRPTAPPRRRAVATAAGPVRVGDAVARDPARSDRPLVHRLEGHGPT